MSKVVGIGTDPWKVPIFERRLKAAGYTYTTNLLNRDITVLLVDAEDVQALAKVVVAANAEAAQAKRERARCELN